MVRAKVSGWIGAAPYWSVRSVPMSSTPSSSNISSTVGTTIACVVPISPERAPRVGGEPREAHHCGARGERDRVVPEARDVVERRRRREPTPPLEVAQGCVDPHPCGERSCRYATALGAPVVPDVCRITIVLSGARIEVEGPRRTRGTGSSAISAPVIAHTCRATAAYSGSATSSRRAEAGDTTGDLARGQPRAERGERTVRTGGPDRQRER